jgi:fatty acid desaturase
LAKKAAVINTALHIFVIMAIVNNLEEISYEEAINEKGISYAVFRSYLSPRFSKVYFDIFKGYFFLLSAICLFIYFENSFYFYAWILVIPFALLIGYIAAYIFLFIHEAAHFNIHGDKKTNDRLATLLLCLPFGLSMKSYRKIHWQHHIHLGTPQDAEVSYFHSLSKFFILETLTGIHLLRTTLRKENNEMLNKEQVKQNKIMLLAGFLFHLLILTVSFLAGYPLLATTWLLAFGLFFPFFATIRQILEHRDEMARKAIDYYKQPHGKVSRLFVHNVLSSSFGAAGFTRHMIHHWDPQISYTRLSDIEKFLLSCHNTAPIIRSSRTTYTKTLKTLLTSA